MDANQVHIATQMSKGFPQMPSDILLMAMLGTIGPLEFTNAPEMRSVAERDEVSLALDLLGRTQGGVLVRRETLWDALAPSTAGYFLTSQGPNADPTWTPGVGAWGLVDAQDLVNVDQYAFLNLLGGYEYHWNFSDITVSAGPAVLQARVSQDNGATWKTSGYKFMGRLEGDTGLMFSYTSTGDLKIIRSLGDGVGKDGNGVLECVSDFGSTTHRKHFHGWDTTVDDAGTFVLERWAGMYNGNDDPIDAVLILVNVGLFSGHLSLWRRPLA